jgi:hypothetical protein
MHAKWALNVEAIILIRSVLESQDLVSEQEIESQKT